jgi:hypothetical protein
VTKKPQYRVGHGLSMGCSDIRRKEGKKEKRKRKERGRKNFL